MLAIPFHVGQNKTDAIASLLKLAKRLFRHIKLILFDRGFYSGELLFYLEKQDISYLMFVPAKAPMKRYIMEGLDFVFHEVRYNPGNTKEKVKVKHVFMEDKKLIWIFATNLPLNLASRFIFLYKKRWQIETNFRVQDEARIKSKSCNYLTRYFYFCISLLLQFLWRVFGNRQFKRFVIELHEYFFLRSIGVYYLFSS